MAKLLLALAFATAAFFLVLAGGGDAPSREYSNGDNNYKTDEGVHSPRKEENMKEDEAINSNNNFNDVIVIRQNIEDLENNRHGQLTRFLNLVNRGGGASLSSIPNASISNSMPSTKVETVDEAMNELITRGDDSFLYSLLSKATTESEKDLVRHAIKTGNEYYEATLRETRLGSLLTLSSDASPPQ